MSKDRREEGGAILKRRERTWWPLCLQEALSIWRVVAEPGVGEEQRKFEIAVVGRVVTTDTLSALHPPSSPGHRPP